METPLAPAGSIVVGIDGSPPSDSALDWAMDQAALERRALTLVHTVEPLRYPGSGMYAAGGVDYALLVESVKTAGNELLDAAEARALAAHPGLSVHRLLTYTDPRSTFLELAKDAAMIVLGSRGRGPITSLLLGSVSVSVSKHATCPVVVRRPADPSGDALGMLVGVDGTKDSLPAVDFAYRTASFRKMPLTVLHCYGYSPDLIDVPDLGNERLMVSESIVGMAEKYPDVEVQVRVTRGPAEKHLVNASRNYDLLVIGHHPITPLADLVYGSVAPIVVERAHGTVVIVPS